MAIHWRVHTPFVAHEITPIILLFFRAHVCGRAEFTRLVQQYDAEDAAQAQAGEGKEDGGAEGAAKVEASDG